jgi:hypothetical protein
MRPSPTPPCPPLLPLVGCWRRGCVVLLVVLLPLAGPLVGAAALVGHPRAGPAGGGWVVCGLVIRSPPPAGQQVTTSRAAGDHQQGSR